MQFTMADLQAMRAGLLPPDSVQSLDDCLAAVERLGFLWAFTPAPGYLPALFTALKTESDGQRWEWVWGWKDRLAAERLAFYGKVVRGKPTLVSREWLPLFYALTGNTGDLEDDLLHLRESGRVPEQAVKVVHYLQEYGPTGTRTLQAKLTDGTKESKVGLNQALFYLDNAMLIVKSGAEGGNSIANIWDLFTNFWPDAVDAGSAIPTREAAERLLLRFFTLTPVIQEKGLDELFPWGEAWQKKQIAHLREAGDLVSCKLEGKPAVAWRAAVEAFRS